MKICVFLGFLLIHWIAWGQDIVPHKMTETNDRKSLQLAWFASTWDTPYEVKKYHKVEIGAQLPSAVVTQLVSFLQKRGKGLNPFNPSDVSLECVFTAPSGKKETVYGFYYQPYKRDMRSNTWVNDTTSYPWRIRFSPDEIGNWQLVVQLIVKGQEVAKSTHFSFNTIKSNHKGYLERSYIGNNQDRYLFYHETGETFFGIGHNITHSDYVRLTPQSSERHLKWLNELAAYGGNFFRLELSSQNALPDWNEYDNYSLKMAEMWEYDQLMDSAFTLGLYFILFRHHVELNYGSWPDNWKDNSYRKGFDLPNFSSYFTHTTADQWQKYCLRYILARWGYNPNFAFYGYSEVDNYIKPMRDTEAKTFEDALTIFTDWNKKQFSYIKDSLNNKRIMTLNTYAAIDNLEFKTPEKGMFNYLDVIGFHSYKMKKDANWDRTNMLNRLWELYKKPVFMEEIGVTDNFLQTYCCTDIDFHNSVWSSTFSGSPAIGMHWWWDRGLHDFGFYMQYKELATFLQNEDFRKMNYVPQRWKDKNAVTKATLEAFYLTSENQERAIGWLHNATAYWRNSFTINSCMQQLIARDSLQFACKMEDGYVIPPLKANYQEEKLKDKYTDVGGIQFYTKGLQNNPTFVVSGLKKKTNYTVEFYSTRTNSKINSNYTQTLKSNGRGQIKPIVPNLDSLQLDYGFKVKLAN
jgi:hypothetical protein